jgi:hypothetical protein
MFLDLKKDALDFSLEFHFQKSTGKISSLAPDSSYTYKDGSTYPSNCFIRRL